MSDLYWLYLMSSMPISRPAPASWQRWAPLAGIAVLLVIAYAPVLARLVRQWNNDDDMGHGFFVPIIAAYIVWQSRHRLMELPILPNRWGLVVVIYSAVQLYIATIGAELFLARTAFVISLFGIVLFLFGTAWLRALLFPLGLLFLMVPIPAVIYNRITFPLQLLASETSSSILSLLGIPVLREGNILELANRRLSVVEACSGIRSLLSLSFLSLVYGYFMEKKTWRRVVLFVATVPIAILANAGRVTITGLLTEYKPELAEGFFHSASGWVIFMVALFILLAFHRLLVQFDRLNRRHA